MRCHRRAVAVVAVLAAACGTRLPDSAFSPAPSPASPSGSPPGTGATDVGVTADTVTIGTITSRSNPIDAGAFVGPLYGLQAFVDDVNRRGGIDGRRVLLRTCDDYGSATQNIACVHKLIDDDHVFALVSNGILDYAGAGIVDADGVPDIGSQPVDDAYTRYPHLWDVTGESYPRTGAYVGYHGVLYNGTEVYRYFKTAYPHVPLRAGVVAYNQAASRRYGDAIAAGLRREGYEVDERIVNVALPDFDAVTIAFKQEGVRYLYDALDRGGNERLCSAVDDNRLPLVAKVTTTQSWTASIGTDYADSPTCRNELFATGGSRNYDDASFLPVARFRAAMARLGLDRPDAMSQWALEGWAGAQWFADAAGSCGPALTRGCVERFMARPRPYSGHGLLTPRSFVVDRHPAGLSRNCLEVVRWQDGADHGAGGWVDQVPDMDTNCFLVPSVPYRP